MDLAKTENIINEYLEYQEKVGNRTELYREVAKSYKISSALYPGSHIDISPSLVIPKVVYVDNFKGTIKFFKNMNPIKSYLDEHKEYTQTCDISFIGNDYSEELGIEPVDLIISQYAGFVGQATKKYLKTGGILLCNDSHGDATLARFDDEFEFIGVIEGRNKIISFNLGDYFTMSSGKDIDLLKVKEKMKGPRYSLGAENYLFRKIR